MRIPELFTNLSIRTRLAGGFTILLSLTILVGVVGDQALDSFSQRSNIVAILGQVNTGLTEARVEEKTFFSQAKLVLSPKPRLMVIAFSS